jgi:flagellar hook-associated protein 3 FlgL
MRVTPTLLQRSFLTNLEDLNQRLETANQQVSSGRRINRLRDDPSGSAETVRLHAELDVVDQYRSNTDASQAYVGTADSALDSAFNLVTSIFTTGSAAASNLNAQSTMATLAVEVRALRDQLLSVANTTVRGRYIFAGANGTSPAFVLQGDHATYQGDESVNKVLIGEGLLVNQNLPGDGAFQSSFDAIEQLLSALDARDVSGIQTALRSVSASLSSIGQQRARLGASLSQLDRSKTEQDTLEANVRTRLSRVEDANMAEAVTQLSQIRTALDAALSARAVVQQRNLFDFMG